jgi:hypothetical protein
MVFLLVQSSTVIPDLIGDPNSWMPDQVGHDKNSWGMTKILEAWESS